MKPEFIVGAYASLPQERDDQPAYYELLGKQEWIGGAELPFPGDLATTANRAWLAHALPAHWHSNVVTAIPGTMRHVGADPMFGLASPDKTGRKAALTFFEDLRTAVADLAKLRGAQDVRFIEIHSAPTRYADADRMAESLHEMKNWDWSGAQLVIEHCDRYIEGQPPEKGFLPLEDEIELCRREGVGLTLNWGRSAVEGRSAQTAFDQVKQATAADVLTGMMFSGAGPDETQYGYSWIDGHLPMAPDEPTSLMGAKEVHECAQVALEQGSPLSYIGAKVCVPKDATLNERLAFLTHIHEAVVA